MKKSKKKHPIKKMLRRCHHTFFCLGFVVGGVFGFNVRKLIDAAVEKLAKKKEK